MTTRTGLFRLFSWYFGIGVLCGCTLPAVDAGHEGVLVAQPLLFGHGGVDPVPVTPGRVSMALTTDLIQVDVRPKQYAEHFGILSSENAAVAFDAFLIVRVHSGRSPELIQRFGPNWYASNVKEAFRTFIREEVQRHPLFQLTTDPSTREKLQDAVADKVQTQVIEKNELPIELVQVVMGSIMPPQTVLDSTVQTIVQQQRVLTMQEFQKAEEARAQAERQRGLADLAYRQHLGLSETDFIDLRRVEVQKELVEHSATQFNIIMNLEHTGIHIPPISAAR
jgi:hypothetical protein